jgi:hypothetical protein
MTSQTMTRWTVRLTAVLVTVVASCAAAVLGSPSAARAQTTGATQAVQFSTDGIHWSDSYTGNLYQGLLLIPNSSAVRSFYVRNGSTQPAILHISLADVTTDNIAFANAVTISSSTTGAPGPTVPVSLAQPCYTLSQGLRLSSGDSLRVDNTVSLTDLTGTNGQTGSVSFALRVSFSSMDAAAPTPNTCPADYGTIDTFPNPADGGGRTTLASASSARRTLYHRTANGWTVGTLTPGRTVTAPSSPNVAEKPSTPLAQALVANTVRLYQEYDVAFWLAMSVLGAVILVLVRRRRAEEQPEAPEQNRQIGTRR